MTAEKIKRKLSTIFCADVQSYSALMASDEAETLGRLRRYRSIMDSLFARHEGRKVNTWGDAVIAEFGSVVEAVRCGIEIQEAIGAENRGLPADRQMWFRIGINLGDVMQDGGDLYGDGVNVASRLESLAEPGGIMVSRTVFDLTQKHLSVDYEFAGEQTVKGQDAPVAGYRIRIASNADEVARTASALDLSTTSTSGREAPSFGRPSPSNSRAVGADGFRGWFRGQPQIARLSLLALAVVMLVNLVTNGFTEAWFRYPAVPLLAIAVFAILGNPNGARRGGLSARFQRLPLLARSCLFAIAIVTGINLVTNGFSEPWFLYPAVPLAAVAVFAVLNQRAT